MNARPHLMRMVDCMNVESHNVIPAYAGIHLTLVHLNYYLPVGSSFTLAWQFKNILSLSLVLNLNHYLNLRQ